MRRTTILPLALALLAVVPLGACDVAAVPWGPASSSYDGQTRVRADGTWANEDSRVAANRLRYRDVAPDDGNTVYVRTLVRWWKYDSVAEGVTWVNGTSKSTPEISSSGYRDARVSWSLDSNASRARAQPEVCAQMGWPVPDSCSDGGVPTFDY